jgi:hypothetical protein
MNNYSINSGDVEAASKRKQVLDMLDIILAQRPTLKLECGEDVAVLNGVTASLLSHCPSGVAIEVASLDGASPQWVGAEASCFFRVNEDPPHAGAHMLTFTSRICSVNCQPNGVVMLVLALPESIGRVQRRRCVRVDVTQEKVPSLKLWPELPSGVAVARKQPLLDTEDSVNTGIRVNNISATGLSLKIAEDLMRQALPQQNKGQRYSLFFTALSSPNCPVTHFWVNAILQNVIENTQESEVCLGFEFIAEGELDERKRIVWQPLKCDEVSGLGKFIFKWNLDNFRDKPLVEC